MNQSGVYEFLAQDRVIFGKPAAEAVVETADRLGAQRVFVVSSQTLSRHTRVVTDIRTHLGERFVGLFDECVAHVPRESVLRAADAVRQAEPDLIVTVGGGTPMDTVKILLICLAEGLTEPDQLDDYRIRVDDTGAKIVPAVKSPPVRQVIVPTTLSGAEFSNLGGASDPVRQVKDIYHGREIGGQVVILDPAASVHTPDWLWLSTGIRAVDHAVETICSRAPQQFTDATCLHGLRLFTRSLPLNKEHPEDLQRVWIVSSPFGYVPPASGGLNGARVMASVTSLAPLPTFPMGIVPASCCPACSSTTPRPMASASNWLPKPWAIPDVRLTRWLPS